MLLCNASAHFALLVSFIPPPHPRGNMYYRKRPVAWNGVKKILWRPPGSPHYFFEEFKSDVRKLRSPFVIAEIHWKKRLVMSRPIHLLFHYFIFFLEWIVADRYNSNAAYAGVYVFLVRHCQMKRWYNRKMSWPKYEK